MAIERKSKANPKPNIERPSERTAGPPRKKVQASAPKAARPAPPTTRFETPGERPAPPLPTASANQVLASQRALAERGRDGALGWAQRDLEQASAVPPARAAQSLDVLLRETGRAIVAKQLGRAETLWAEAAALVASGAAAPAALATVRTRLDAAVEADAPVAEGPGSFIEHSASQATAKAWALAAELREGPLDSDTLAERLTDITQLRDQTRNLWAVVDTTWAERPFLKAFDAASYATALVNGGANVDRLYETLLARGQKKAGRFTQLDTVAVLDAPVLKLARQLLEVAQQVSAPSPFAQASTREVVVVAERIDSILASTVAAGAAGSDLAPIEAALQSAVTATHGQLHDHRGTLAKLRSALDAAAIGFPKA